MKFALVDTSNYSLAHTIPLWLHMSTKPSQKLITSLSDVREKFKQAQCSTEPPFTIFCIQITQINKIHPAIVVKLPTNKLWIAMSNKEINFNSSSAIQWFTLLQRNSFFLVTKKKRREETSTILIMFHCPTDGWQDFSSPESWYFNCMNQEQWQWFKTSYRKIVSI